MTSTDTSVRTSDNPVTGLPASAYTDHAFFVLEQEKLFAGSWVCIGIIDDVPEAGDARPVRVAGRDVLMVRDGHDEVRVFHNFCRHRGYPIVTEPVHGLKRLVCPYHAWAYDLDGTLKRAPHFDGTGKHRNGADAAKLPGLRPVRTATWHRLVFINLSADAQPFDAFIAPLAERWSAYDFSQLRHGKALTFDAACNWKLAIENFIDFYHLPAVHKGLNSYSSMQDHHFIRQDGVFIGEGNDHYAPEDAAAGQLPVFPGLDPELNSKTEALCLFPNLLITVFNDNLRVIIVEPLEAGTCREHVHVFFVGDEAMSADLDDHREMAAARFVEFNTEDIEIVETLQKGFAGNGFDGGRFSPYFDQNIHHFQELVLNATGT